MPTIKKILIILVIIVRLRAQQLLTSLDIQQLIKTHKHVTACLQKGKGHPVLNKYSRLYQREQRAMALAEDYVGNPINVLILIKRLSKDLQHVEKYMSWIRTESDGLIFPDEQDLRDTVVTFWRLQVIYDLNVTHLAAGKLYGQFSHGAKPYFDQALTMLISDCMELARHIYYNLDYNKSLLWALESLKKYYNKEPDEIYPDEDELAIVRFILSCYIKIRDYKKATEWTRKYMSLQPDLLHSDPFDDSYFSLPEDKKDYCDILCQRCNQCMDCIKKKKGITTSQQSCNKSAQLLSSISISISDDNVVDLDFDNLERLCRGEVPLAHEKRKSLHCYYKFSPNPFLRLAPFKAEQLHEEPPIFIFYDVVSEANFDIIKHGVMNELKPSTVSNELHARRTDRTVRDSVSVRIHPLSRTLSPAVRSVAGDLLRLAEDVTDFNTDSAEDLLVTRYGVGGYYTLHHDFFPDPTPVYGHRIATALFYCLSVLHLQNNVLQLSDVEPVNDTPAEYVEQGGATVFPGPRLTVYPVKGAVLLWFNLVPSGQKDYRTLHASCPVLRGAKWVISLWIHEQGQEFIRPCSLEYQEIKPTPADFSII